jgi:hypothetical protein
VLVGLDPLMPQVARPARFVDDPASPAPPAAVPAVFVASARADALFGRPLDGLAVGTAGKPVALSFVPKVESIPFPSRNVVAVLPGSDPALARQYVAVGAHNDHVGTPAAPSTTTRCGCSTGSCAPAAPRTRARSRRPRSRRR